MFLRAVIPGILALFFYLDKAAAGEFVTQEKPSLPGRALPYCSSTFGCFLSGVRNLPDSQLIPDRPMPPVALPPPDASLPIAPVTIAAEPGEIDHLKDLVASVPETKVKVVERGKTASAKIDFYMVTVFSSTSAKLAAGVFEDQLHILAAGDIRSFEDLQNKVVSLGPDDSASQAVGRLAFAALRIPIKETPLDLDNALDGLSTGDVEAVVILGPQPIARLKQLTTPGLHLMSWPDGVALPAGADVSAIEPGTYPGLAPDGKAIPALGVEAILTKNNARSRVDVDEMSLAARLRSQTR